jgi:helix-turn-helix protein
MQRALAKPPLDRVPYVALSRPRSHRIVVGQSSVLWWLRDIGETDGVATTCRVLAVSASGYYAWRKWPPSARARADAELTARITAIHQYSRATYGAPRIHEELLAAGMHLGRKRVARLMKNEAPW